VRLFKDVGSIWTLLCRSLLEDLLIEGHAMGSGGVAKRVSVVRCFDYVSP